jgi:DNA-binding CsgD family transcriptional regulator
VTNRDDDILEELRKATRLLSVIATQGLSQRDQIVALARVGFTPKETAELLGTTPNTVSVYLSAIRKERSRNAKK